MRWRAWLGVMVAGLAPVAAAGQQEPVAFVNVTVVPMDSARVLPHQTVVVRGGRVVALGDTGEVAVPPGARRVEGGGAYLMPGLYDLYAHVHEWALELFLANGVTTVRNAAPGLPVHLGLRDEVARGARLGPRIRTTGPVLDGLSPSYASAGPIGSVAEARAIVAAQHRAGYDAIMVYVGIEPFPYLAALEAARELGLPVSGHRPERVPPELFLRGGQRSKDNLIGEVNTATGGLWVPAEHLDRDVQAVAASGMWTIPTLTIHRARARQDSAAVLLAAPEMRYVPPRQRMHWRRAEGRLVAVRGNRYSGAPELVRRLHAAGARLLLGTDAGYPFVVHGVAIHEELANLVEAGLSPYEALRAGTRDAAEYLGELAEAGTVAVGKRADLLLLHGNPLADVAAVSRRVGVMIGGRWLPEAELQERLARLAATAAEPRDRFAAMAPLPACGAAAQCARYEIRLRGLTVGEERMRVTRERGGGRTLRSQSVIDPHLETRTELVARADGRGAPRELEVRRWMSGVEWTVALARRGARAEVRARTPYQPAARWEMALPEGALLGGPYHAVNVDVDLVGSLQLVVERGARLAVGEGRLVTALRAKLNDEEHGRRGVVGETGYWLSREGDGEGGERRYRLQVQGLNGSGATSLRLRVGREGLLASMASADGTLEVVRVE